MRGRRCSEDWRWLLRHLKFFTPVKITLQSTRLVCIATNFIIAQCRGYIPIPNNNDLYRRQTKHHWNKLWPYSVVQLCSTLRIQPRWIKTDHFAMFWRSRAVLKLALSGSISLHMTSLLLGLHFATVNGFFHDSSYENRKESYIKNLSYGISFMIRCIIFMVYVHYTTVACSLLTNVAGLWNMF